MRDVGANPISRRQPIPEDALPPCETCERPELSEENQQVWWFWQMVQTQQQYAGMNGAPLGLRIEAVVAALDWCDRNEKPVDQDIIMERIWIIDEIYCKRQHDRMKSSR